MQINILKKQKRKNIYIFFSTANFSFTFRDLSDIGGSRSHLAESPMYTPRYSDVGDRKSLQCTIEIISDSNQLLWQMKSRFKVICPPATTPFRKFIELESQVGAIKIVTYNILAPTFGYEKSKKLTEDRAWEIQTPFRSSRLLAKINNYKADVMCFQEVSVSYLNLNFMLI